MNNFRTLILILASVTQISWMFSNKGLESLNLIEFTGKVFKEVKLDTSAKMTLSSKDLCQNKSADIQCLNHPVCPKESSLENKVSQVIISNKSDNERVVKTFENIPQTIKKGSVMGQINFSVAVNAELY